MSGKQRLTTEEATEVVRRYRAGDSLEALSVHFQISEGPIHLILFRAGVALRKGKGGHPQTPAEIEDEMVRLYVTKEMGTLAICDKFDKDKGTLYNILKRKKIGTRAPGGASPRKKPHYEARKKQLRPNDEKIRVLHEQGLNPSEIGRECNMTAAGVTYSLNKQGLYKPRYEGSPEIAMRQKERKYVPKAKHYHIREDRFDDLTPTAMYYLGFLMADGCVHKSDIRPSYRLFVNISIQDMDLLQDFKAWLESNHQISTSWADHWDTQEPKQYASFAPTADRLCRRLIELGVTPAKSQTAKAPDVALNSADFWRGCMDGDGCVYSRDQGTAYLSGSQTMINQFEAYCASIVPGLTLAKHHHISHVGKMGCWVGRIKHQVEAAEILRTLYGGEPEQYLVRKRALAATHWA